MARSLPASWFARDSWVVAPQLLNKLLRVDDRIARILEVEAYASTDPASHTFRGRTARNAVMFGPGGHLYVYFSYGVHWCANVVTGPVGSGQAVLLRAGEPVQGIEAMRAARGPRVADRDLCRGPGRLTQALGISSDDNGASLRAGRVRVLDDGVAPPEAPANGPRVGITKATDVPWRWWVPGHRGVSARSLGNVT